MRDFSRRLIIGTCYRCTEEKGNFGIEIFKNNCYSSILIMESRTFKFSTGFVNSHERFPIYFDYVFRSHGVIHNWPIRGDDLSFIDIPYYFRGCSFNPKNTLGYCEYRQIQIS